MSGRILFIMIILGFVNVLDDIIMSFIRKKMGKKANYDCSKCEAFDCPNIECMKHRG